MSDKIKLSPPWYNFYREVMALFGEDPDINVVFDEDNNVIKLYVENHDKADALEQILPKEKSFGNVSVYIEVIPKNKEMSTADLYRKAFEGNPAYSFTATIDGIMTNPLHYVVFKNRVVQYWNDNLGDINGNTSTLYEIIARDIFDGTNNVCFNTDTKENLAMITK